MGGRSREFTHSDRWSWVGELSEKRLDRYGYMSSNKIDNYNDKTRKGALNYELTREYRNRNGVDPEWAR